MSQHEKVAAYFNEQAAVYNQQIKDNEWQGIRLMTNALQQFPGIYARVFELGAGTGITLETIKQNTSPAPEHTTAVDISQNMLEQCRARHADDPSVRIAHTAVDAFLSDAKTRGEKADLITAIALFSFMPPAEMRQVTQLAADCLNQQGRLMFTFEPAIEFHPILASPWVEYPELTFYRIHPDEVLDTLDASNLKLRQFRLHAPRPASPVVSGFVVAEKA